MKELLFKNYVFRKGMNLSVRRGNREEQFEFKKEICLKTTDRTKSQKAILVAANSKKFIDITAREIQFEHDPNCQIYSGLLTVMKDIYSGFEESEEVTLIFFIPMKSI